MEFAICRVFPDTVTFVPGSHTFAMFYARALHDKQNTCYPRAHIVLTTFTRFDQNWSTGCLLALYGSTMHPARQCGGF